MSTTKLRKLKELLTKNKLIDDKGLREAEKEAFKANQNLETFLLTKNLIKQERLGQVIAEVNQWDFVNLNSEGVDDKVLKLIPEKIAKKQQIIAFEKTKDGIKVAMNNPDVTTLLHLLQKKLGHKMIPYYATTSDLKTQFSKYKKDIQEEFEQIIREHVDEAVAKGEQESSTVQIINMLLERGYESNASDIHIEPYEKETVVRFRIDGIMKDIIVLPKNAHDLLISRIKVMSHLRIDEHRVPQDGKIKYIFDEQKMDVRVSIIPTTNGENAVMRLLSEKSSQLSLEELGYSEKNLMVLKRNISKPWGMILATGPTGSGKTTTLYAILQILNKKSVNIATIEDPVEYSIEGITQIQVNQKANLNFSSGLRSLVRQDPDIIMIGEIRDTETAEIAINSAMTGHLVLSTLHTNDAPTALPRLLDMKIEPFLIASIVNVIVAQRLIRKICSKCITSYELSKEELSKKLPHDILEKFIPENSSEKIKLFKGEGCEFCNRTGYSGRKGIYEVLEVNDEIRELVIKKASAEVIKKKAIECGMTTMFDDARENVLKGVTSLEEMMRVVKQ